MDGALRVHQNSKLRASYEMIDLFMGLVRRVQRNVVLRYFLPYTLSQISFVDLDTADDRLG